MTGDSTIPQLSTVQPHTGIDPLRDFDGVALDFPFHDLAWTTVFDFDADNVAWPQSSGFNGSDYTPTEESWIASVQAAST